MHPRRPDLRGPVDRVCQRNPGSPRMNDAPRLKLVEVERYERDVRLRLPFRFGVTTVTHATQAVIRATIARPDGGTSSGVAAETLAAKWFDKNLALSHAQNLDQLRQS